MDKGELVKLRGFLARSFGADGIKVQPHATRKDAANVAYGERKLGLLSVDDEDGDRSFAFEMAIPVGRETLQEYLRRLFDNDKLRIARRAGKRDSVELFNGEDFLGIISSDDPKGSSHTLQMAILDFDLEDI
ncbi:MAG: DUF3126 family protein [Hyphomicrobiales bacterium]|nr:DUF3126 family protein [Hyphomicrobiales bacterium]